MEKLEQKDLVVWGWIDSKLITLAEMEARAWRVPGVVEQVLEKLVRLKLVVKTGMWYRGVIPGESKKYN